MSMALRGRAKVRKVGNGLAVPIPTREAADEGIEAGIEVEYVVIRPRPINARAFGSLRKELRGVDLQRLADEDRQEGEA